MLKPDDNLVEVPNKRPPAPHAGIALAAILFVLGLVVCVYAASSVPVGTMKDGLVLFGAALLGGGIATLMTLLLVRDPRWFRSADSERRDHWL